MPLSSFQVFNQWVYTTFLGKLSYNVNLFNAATRGGLILRDGANPGDYSDEALYARISNLIRRRDAYGSGDVSAVDISMLLDTSVKVAAGTPPVNIDPGMWDWINRSPEEAGVVIGTQLAEETLADFLGVAIRSLVAATINTNVLVYDGTAGNNSLGALNSAASLYGDRASQLRCWLIHSKPMFDMFGAALTNTAQLFTFGTVQIRADALGNPFVVADVPDLKYTSSGTKYRTLGLTAGAAIVTRNNDYLENMETKNGKENIVRTWQAQWSFNLGIKGYAWDKTNGGKSPTNAALAVGTNWDRYAEADKDLPAIVVNTQ